MKNEELWKKIKEWLIESDSIEPNIYDEYIKTAMLRRLSEQHLVVIVKTELSKWYLENILSVMRSKASFFLENDVDLSLMTNEEYEKELNITELIEQKRKKLKSQDFMFENFIFGSSNMNAYKASKAIVENIGTKWNPLFIYGDSGLGKTHLLKAIAHEIGNTKNKLVVKYYTSSNFRKEIVDSLQDGFKEIESTKEKLSKIDVLLIDDIQFLANSGKTNEIFFNLFNFFIENNKQIVLTSDKFPEQLNGFDKRLVSRFSQGLNVKVETPDIITAINIVDYKAKIVNLNLSEESKKYIASFFGSDVRKIEGIINKIEFSIIQDNSAAPKIIELEDINKFLEDYSFAPGGEITVQKIKNVVAQNYGISVKSIDSRLRMANIVKARHVAMFLTGEILKKNYSEIGVAFGGKDHTTVLHAFKKINDLLEKDKIFKKTLTKIKKEITS